MSNQEQNEVKLQYRNISIIKPKFWINDGSLINQKELLTASDRITLSINLSKYRLRYALETKPITLEGKIYHNVYFDFFLKIACAEYNESEEKNIIEKNSLYLYVYSDIWGFDELKEKINKCWIENPSLLEFKANDFISKQFLEDLIDLFCSENESIDNQVSLSPIDFFIKNINELLKDKQLISIPPEILNIIIEKIDSSKLDSKIYFDFLIKYLEFAQENDKDLIPYSILIHHINFDELGYEELKKFAKFEIQTKYKDYFDFLTINQFKAFANKIIDENDKTKETIRILNEKIDNQINEYKEKISKINQKHEQIEKDIKELTESNQKTVVETIKNSLKQVEEIINNNQSSISSLDEEIKKLKDFSKKEDKLCENVTESLKKFDSIYSKVDEMNKNYQVSSYIVSSINQQFIPITENQTKIFNYAKNIELETKIKYKNKNKEELLKNDILCKIELSNIDRNKEYDFDPFLISHTNPVIYFRFKQEDSIDLFVKKYEIEIDNVSERSILSWRLEGYFPNDFQSYSAFKYIEDPSEINDENWFPISIHSIADISNQDNLQGNQTKNRDTLSKNGNVYTCTLDFSPICRYIRFRMIRNSNDDNTLTINSLKVLGKALQPYYA